MSKFCNTHQIKTLAALFRDGHHGGASNSTTNGVEYHLFGHRIARVEGGNLIGNWCGYPTASTQRHLSNIAYAFDCPPSTHALLRRSKGAEMGAKDFVMKENVR